MPFHRTVWTSCERRSKNRLEFCEGGLCGRFTVSPELDRLDDDGEEGRGGAEPVNFGRERGEVRDGCDDGGFGEGVVVGGRVG